MIDWFNNALELLSSGIGLDNPILLLVILLLTFMADIGTPVPFALDTILFINVFQNGILSVPLLLILIMMLIGRLLGTSLLYLIGFHPGLTASQWLIKRNRIFARYFPVFRKALTKWAVSSIVIGRLTPGLMQIASFAAGILRIKYLKLVLSILLASAIYDGTIILLATFTRVGLADIGPESTIWVVLGFVALLLLFFLFGRKILPNYLKRKAIE